LLLVSFSYTFYFLLLWWCYSLYLRVRCRKPFTSKTLHGNSVIHFVRVRDIFTLFVFNYAYCCQIWFSFKLTFVSCTSSRNCLPFRSTSIHPRIVCGGLFADHCLSQLFSIVWSLLVTVVLYRLIIVCHSCSLSFDHC
jgi:hypothetical protein